jgi:uncharacterized cupredoxin-like copper-binding protein
MHGPKGKKMDRTQAVRLAGLLLALAGAGSAHAAAQAVRVDRSWLQADSAGSQVQFALIAGLTPANGGMNFNGASNGTLTLTVPVGWHVTLHFRNADQAQPHSVAIIPAVTPVPVTVARPAFEHAATRNLMSGLGTGAHEDMVFTVDRAGAFYIFCAVPGHGAAGMWIRLNVSADAHTATIAATPKP